mgnify:CR=1 FL=1
MKQPFCAPAEALRRVLDAAAALPRPAVENVGLDEACGRIAAAPLCARMDQPPFDRSPLDGYALHSADTAGAGEMTPKALPVVMKLYAGDAPTAELPAGCAARIMTGAPLPAGADCVLMQEQTDGGEETGRAAKRDDEVGVAFQVDDIHPRVRRQAEPARGDVHHERKPLAVGRVAEDGGNVVIRKGIIRLDAVCVEDVSGQFGAGHKIASPV